MFGIDFSEILVIFGIALIVLGPEKLPRLARTVGRWVGRARAMARQFREQLEQEADALHRSADLRTPPPTPPATAAPPPPPPPPVVSIVPDTGAADTGAPATDAVGTGAAATDTDTHAHQQQPASPAAEPHERTG
jgi:sec-independent protein translocase protein TatB